MSAADARRALAAIAGPGLPDTGALEDLLGRHEPSEVAEILETADRVRHQYMGDGVLLRGIVEFSSFCANTCFYCGLHGGNGALERYRMNGAEILEAVDHVARQGIRTVVLQSGEDALIDTDWLAGLVRQIRGRHDMAVTLSVGERPREDFARWREAGADRYLLKIESSDPDLYASLHERRALESRLRCVRDLFDLGYQVGSGVMVGVPGQTGRHLAQDIRYFAQNDFDMIGIGPFIPHPQTRLAGRTPGTVEMTLKTVALTRICTRTAHLPATTALGSLGKDYRADGLKAGANVLMPNFTPVRYKKLYEIYPGKRCISEPAGACAFCMEGMVAGIGRSIDYSRGDSLKGRFSMSRPPRAPALP
ncbi:MAG TPA: [FeFe] hydrogenase H-cluster radical SAM maturase HydE [Spirochaetia bacterium]|nr:[FeFe] hydrogenase H-cluster radical SAM maturase HydE [Spirochaetia bacterium]